MNKKFQKTAVIVSALVVLAVFISASVTLEEDTEVYDNINTSYIMPHEMEFEQVEVYEGVVQFSNTNLTTTSQDQVGVEMYEHNFSKIDQTVARYQYNRSAETKFDPVNSSLYYEIYVDGSEEDEVTDQDEINVNIPSGSELEIKAFDNRPPELVEDQQYYDNATTGHEFNVEAYASDPDGEEDFEECRVTYNADQEGELQGTIDTSWGSDEEVKCSRSIDDSIEGVEAFGEVETSVRFYDGFEWVNTSIDSNVVPNNPPTGPESFTELEDFETSEEAEIEWSGVDDPDGDDMELQAYLGQEPEPNHLENSKHIDSETDSGSIKIGEETDLEDGETYYYRLRLCDEYDACADYTEDVEFTTNSAPQINYHNINDSNPESGDKVKIETGVEDENLERVGFRVEKDEEQLIVDQQNGTLNEGTMQDGEWISEEFEVEEEGFYEYTVTAEDETSTETVETGNLSQGYLEQGIYSRTYDTESEVRDVKINVHGETNNQNIDLQANTSNSGKIALENNTWTSIEPGEDLTTELILESDGTQTPEIDSYEVKYLKDFEQEGYLKTMRRDFGSEVKVFEIEISEEQEEGTDIKHEVRTGPDASSTEDWTDWIECEPELCEPELEENRYFQYRANLEGTETETPEINIVNVRYQ